MQRFGFTAKYYPADTVILRQGESDARTYLLESGWASLYRSLSNGNRQIIDIQIGGDIVGHFTDRSLRHETFASITELRVWEGKASALPAAFTEASELADFLYNAIARSRSLLGERLAGIGQRSATVCTVHFLLELGVRLELIGHAKRNFYHCPLTQAVLADVLGLTAIHLNRTLRHAREAGLLHFRRGEVEFLDYEAAISFAEFDGSYIVG